MTTTTTTTTTASYRSVAGNPQALLPQPAVTANANANANTNANTNANSSNSSSSQAQAHPQTAHPSHTIHPQTRLPPFYQPSDHTHTGYHLSPEAVAPPLHHRQPSPGPSRLHSHSHSQYTTYHDGPESVASSSRYDDSNITYPSSATSHTLTGNTLTTRTLVDDHPPSRKRRRSREPDWKTFYRNGLPKEIIVIDDTPEPEPDAVRREPAPPLLNAAATTTTTTPSAAAAAAAAAAPTSILAGPNGPLPPPILPPTAIQAADATARQLPRKRRRDEPPPGPEPYHVHYVPSSHSHVSILDSTPGSSTLSSDRTPALHATAPTSSLVSSTQYVDTVGAPKRKRTTRQQVANEAKQKEANVLAGPFAPYRPPPFPPKKAGEVHVRAIHDHTYNKGVKVDDEDGHYIVVPDADLTEKYRIVRLLGQGTFGKVVQAHDRKQDKAVAIKIIRSVQKYRDASRIELRVLATIKANDQDDRNRCIHLRDCFDYRGHVCIVMDLLGQSVFDFLKGNLFVPFPNSHIQSFARQLFSSVAFLHDLNLIHTDLKPENILLYNNAYQTFTYNRKIPSSSSTVSRQANQRRVLLDTEIRLIDFGSATFQDEYHSSVVSTRHYRAPEIILGLGWSFPCDIWSIGCILVEFYTGDALFQTHDNLEHLAMMEAVVGSRIDTSLVQSVNKMSTRGNGNQASKYFKRLKLDYPQADTTRGSKRFVKAMKHLSDIIPPTSPFFRNFLDLLKKIFVYDPAHRITAKQALDHPWFKELAQPDDGTEAAKIRLERKRLEQEKARHVHYPAP